MTFTIKRLFVLCILILCFGGLKIVVAEDDDRRTTSTTTSASTKTETRKNSASNPTGNPHVDKNENFFPPHKDENGNPLPPPKDENGNPLPPPKDENGNPLPPPKDENGNPIPPQFDENGNRIPPPEDGHWFKKEKNVMTYLVIFCGVILFILLVLLIYIFKYKRSINGKIKRLEQVKDMQSLEASNPIPLTTVSPNGIIEDKRDLYSHSQNSSMRKNILLNESLSLQSSHSGITELDDAYLYQNEFDFNNGPNYITPSQVLVNKNLGLKYNKQSIEQINSGYDSASYSRNHYNPSKSDLDGLYSKTLEAYENNNEDIVVSPIRPRSMIYETGAGISPIHTSNIYNAQVVSTPNSLKTIVPSRSHNSLNNLSKIRAYNTSLPNLTKLNYDNDVSYSNSFSGNGQMKYNVPGVSAKSPKSPKSPKMITSVGHPSQVRVDQRKNRSYSIDITKSKRASYIESMGKRSPNLYSSSRGSPAITNRRNSAISESRSAKSVLIDQMVLAMDMEAESDDTLSNFQYNDGMELSTNSNSKATITTGIKPKVVNIPKESSMASLKKSSTITNQQQIVRVSSESPPSSSSYSIQKNNYSQITDSNRTISNSQELDEVKIKISDEDTTNESSGIEIPTHHKKYKKIIPERNILNRDFIKNPVINAYESDSYYESNNSFSQSIYDEVRVFEVEEDEDDHMIHS